MLVIENLVFNGWGRRFFDQASVTLPVGAKVGLIGRNGVGKSTLFRLILGDLIPDGGEITLPKAARIGSVDQEHPATPVSLLDTILAADTRRDALNAKLEAVRVGPWKLAIALQSENAGKPQEKAPEPFVPRLYNLDTDIGERTDVAAEHPDVVKKLQEFVATMDADLGVSGRGPGVRPPDRVMSPLPLLLK